jgi:hypothetical protein
MKLWKIQKFFGDVVYDLRQRGMLPIVLLLLVGMVAVPFLITGGGSTSSSPAGEAVIEEAAELAPENQKAVVAYEPGVRDYKDRLKTLTAKDPFKQQFSAAAAAASELSTSVGGGGAAGGETTTSTSDTTSEGTSTGSTGGDTGGETTTDPGSPKTGGGGGSPDPGKTKTRYLFYVTDLEVGDIAVGPQRRNGVRALTPLPSPSVPVAVYLGVTVDGKRALFMLSKAVTQVSDTSQCLPSPQECSMVSLEPGASEDLLYSTDGKVYRIKVLKNRRVVRSKLPG